MIPWPHATLRESGLPGEAPPASHRSVEARAESCAGSREDRQFAEFCIPVAASLSRERHAGAGLQAGARAAAQAGSPPKTGVDADSCSRGAELRLLIGSVDPEARGRRDPRTFRGALSSQSHVALPSGLGMEQPEANEAGPGTGREGHRALEALHLAAYKKRPNATDPIWSFSTKAGSSCFLASSAPGLPEARRRSCVARDAGPKYLPSRRSRFPRSASAWPSTRDSIRARTSAPRSRPLFFVSSTSICGAVLSSFGMAAISTRGRPFGRSSKGIRVGVSIASPATLPNSIRMNLSGACSKGRWPIALPKTFRISSVSSTPRL